LIRWIKITTKETKLKESYENGECPFCKSEEIYHPIICPDYGYVFECEGEACKYCVEENKDSNQDIYLCVKCSKGYDFKERYEISMNKTKLKGTQTTLPIGADKEKEKCSYLNGLTNDDLFNMDEETGKTDLTCTTHNAEYNPSITDVLSYCTGNYLECPRFKKAK